MPAHDGLQINLERRIQWYADSEEKDWRVRTEHCVDPPTVVSSRRADVAVLTHEPANMDYALEIKTEGWTGQVLVHQIRDYLLAGYRPIVVAPENISTKTLNSEAQYSLGWLLQFLCTSVVIPIYSDGTSFELREDRLPLDDPLRDFFLISDQSAVD
jgi:hypothetical protein